MHIENRAELFKGKLISEVGIDIIPDLTHSLFLIWIDDCISLLHPECTVECYSYLLYQGLLHLALHRICGSIGNLLGIKRFKEENKMVEILFGNVLAVLIIFLLCRSTEHTQKIRIENERAIIIWTDSKAISEIRKRLHITDMMVHRTYHKYIPWIQMILLIKDVIISNPLFNKQDLARIMNMMH